MAGKVRKVMCLRKGWEHGIVLSICQICPLFWMGLLQCEISTLLRIYKKTIYINGLRVRMASAKGMGSH